MATARKPSRDSTPSAGDPCPNGCTVREYPFSPEEPERILEALPGSGDGEMYCPTCGDAWNTFNPAVHQH